MRAFGFIFCLSLFFAAACSDPGVTPRDGGGDGARDSSTGSCEAPTELCGTRCVNTQTDGRNCGSCGAECAAGTFCFDGECSRSCPSGTTECGGDCAELSSNRSHCGACDNTCADDEDCRGGACNCPEGYTRCGDACVDPDSDDANCGICDRACDPDQTCNMGMCTCSAGARETECLDDIDDDCDGLVDCEDPDCAEATRPCMGTCGAGIETCAGDGTWSSCEGGSGGEEICGDGIDQDCDGVDPRNEDSFEPNNSCDECALVSPTADPVLTINARFDSVMDNVDCFRFIADDGISGENIDVALTNIPAGHDYDLYLYRNYDDCVARDALVSSNAFGNTDENVCYAERFALDDGGTYYIRVIRYRGNSCTDDYSLSIDGLNSPRPCP